MLTFNRDRAVQVCREAVNAWQEKRLGFQRYEPPEWYFRPEGVVEGTLAYANYLFFCGWVNRSGKTADEVIRWAALIAREHPEFIDPRRFKGTIPFRLKEVMQQAIPFANDQPERVEWWLRCLARLRDRYDGDPRNIFLQQDLNQDPLQIRQSLVNELRQFMGIEHKIAQLIIIWFQDIKWPKQKRVWQQLRRVPAVPVDIWVMRLIYQFGLIESYGSDERDMVSRPISDFLAEICYTENLPHGDLSQALWHLGARIHRWYPTDQDGKTQETYCIRNCPMSPYCTSVVPPNRAQTNRRSVMWHAATERPTGHLLFPAEDLIALEMGRPVKALATPKSAPGPTVVHPSFSFEE